MFLSKPTKTTKIVYRVYKWPGSIHTYKEFKTMDAAQSYADKYDGAYTISEYRVVRSETMVKNIIGKKVA